jgi:hypothetical protein
LKAQFGAPVHDRPAFVKFAYYKEAIIMPPGAPAVCGQEEIFALLAAFPPFSGFSPTSTLHL